MKKFTYVLAAASLAVLTAPAATGAQFKLPKLLGQSSAQSNDAAVSGDALVQTFVGSNKEVLLAQAFLAEAYGMKDKAALLRSESETISSHGITSDQIAKAVDLSKSASEEIAARQSQQAQLSAEEKKLYVQSLPHFVKGVVGTRKLVDQAAHFTNGMKSSLAGGLGGGMTKLKAGMAVAKATPSYSKSLFDAFRKTVMIGRKNDVKLPDDATAALSGI